MQLRRLFIICIHIIGWELAKPSTYLFQRYEHMRDKLSEAHIGDFKITWDQNDPYILITSIHEPEKVLFQTLPSWAFITIGYAMDSSPPIVDGNYKVNEWTLYETPNQNIKKVTLLENEFIISGDIWGVVTMASYTLRFSIPSTDDDHMLPNQLAFNLTVNLQQGTFNRLFLNYWCDLEEKFYGFGVQYSHWNLKGRRIPILVAEQGIGRGSEPITSFLNFFADRAGGDWSTTYAPKPVYITSHNRSILIENSEMTFFDLRDDDSVVIETWSHSLCGRILYGSSLLSLITEITAYTGRMKALPTWTQTGAIVGMQGGTEVVLKNLEKLNLNDSVINKLLLSPPLSVSSSIFDKTNKTNSSSKDSRDSAALSRLPLAGVWLQDWVGQRHSYDGDRLQWNWVLNNQHYPYWHEKLVQPLAEQNTRVLTYINPFFARAPNNSRLFAADSDSRRDLCSEGIANGYFVKDSTNNSYLLASGSIEFHMVDFTNPGARVWMKEIIKTELIQHAQSSGWMTDFGEYLPFDAVLFDGSSAASQHNLYPQQWAILNEEACREAHAEGLLQTFPSSTDQGTDCEFLYFLRSGWIQSPKHARLFWLGDQLVTWDEHDGLKSSIVAALSGGLTGHSLTHADIGGYTMHDSGPYPYRRSEELLLRWIEVSTFGNAVFRTHTGLSISDYNAQIYSSPRLTLYFTLFTQVFVKLTAYRKVLMEEAEKCGWPMIRSMAAHYAYDNVTWDLTEQFMFGADFLIASVLTSAALSTEHVSKYAKNHPMFDTNGVIKAVSVKVYIPAFSEWIHLWSGQLVINHDSEGRYVSVDAPIGAPPVFYRRDSTHGTKLREDIKQLGMNVLYHSISNNKNEDETEQQKEKSKGKWAGEMGMITDYRARDWLDYFGLKSVLGSGVGGGGHN